MAITTFIDKDSQIDPSSIFGTPGPQGPQGTTGVTGPQGGPGPQGVQGARGIQGAQGPQGRQGSQGLTGAGTPGVQGATGSPGAQGAQGAIGTGVELKGTVPTVGDLPPSGNTTGDAYVVVADNKLYVWNSSQWVDVGSITGPQGIQGAQGATGVQGAQGAQGQVGAQGFQGAQGAPGVQGAQGATGSGTINGTGTTNYVAKFSDGTTITNSTVVDSGTSVAIGPIQFAGSSTVSGGIVGSGYMVIDPPVLPTTNFTAMFKQQQEIRTVLTLWNTNESTSPGDPDTGLVVFITDGGDSGDPAATRGTIVYNRSGGLIAYNTTSDYRIKDVYGPITNSGSLIDSIKVYRGKMHGATVERPMIIAHELQEAAPYAVSGIKDEVDELGNPKYQQVDTSSLVPLLIAEIQSLRNRVAELEAKI